MESWCRILLDGKARLGLRQDEHILIHDGDLFSSPAPNGQSVAIEKANWLPPVEPRQFLGMLHNLRAALAPGDTTGPSSPLYFAKLGGCMNVHRGRIQPPEGYEDQVVFEAELGVVIGRECYKPSAEAIDDYIFGYTCVNDVTAIGPLKDNKQIQQWTRAKSYPGFGPVGPWIVRGIDPDHLVIQAYVDGEKRQDYPVSDMIFSPRELVMNIASEIPLYPGDLIACGTSVGNGVMHIGQTVEIRIAGIGSLVNVYE
jgi:2-keto-4-pentenoate hydratase/2-oxohepta-3-ene-1,7-dioic acid hydratase in catechol pathway